MTSQSRENSNLPRKSFLLSYRFRSEIKLIRIFHYFIVDIATFSLRERSQENSNLSFFTSLLTILTFIFDVSSKTQFESFLIYLLEKFSKPSRIYFDGKKKKNSNRWPRNIFHHVRLSLLVRGSLTRACISRRRVNKRGHRLLVASRSAPSLEQLRLA